MSKILTVAVILCLAAWTIIFFIYDYGMVSHLFLVLATLLFIIKVLDEK